MGILRFFAFRNALILKKMLVIFFKVLSYTHSSYCTAITHTVLLLPEGQYYSTYMNQVAPEPPGLLHTVHKLTKLNELF